MSIPRCFGPLHFNNSPKSAASPRNCYLAISVENLGASCNMNTIGSYEYNMNTIIQFGASYKFGESYELLFMVFHMMNSN